jgi:hypothetical protein
MHFLIAGERGRGYGLWPINNYFKNKIQKIKIKFFEMYKDLFLMLNLQIEIVISQAYIAIVPSLNNNIYFKLGSHVTTNMHALLYIVNLLSNHAHFSHILVCVTHFLVTICFSKKHHFKNHYHTC